jgi:DNA recombination protein RmuC
MIEPHLAAALVLLVVVALLLGFLLWRSATFDDSRVLARLDILEKFQERGERTLMNALERNRQEAVEQARGLRGEVQNMLKLSTDSLVQSADRISAAQQQRLEDFSRRLTDVKQTSDSGGAQLRSELATTLGAFKESQESRLVENTTQLQQHFDSFGRRLAEFSLASYEQTGKTRTELSTTMKDFQESLQRQLVAMAGLQKQQLDSFGAQIDRLVESSEKKSDELRATIEARLAQLQSDNATKLEEMRRTVDEKLQGTLEKRLGESFKLVSERLELVHKGLGEMQTLALGVGDLKRVLTNVKTRGTWSEVQLGNLLDQILTPEQYARNVSTKPGGREIVEFALKLPGRDDANGKAVWLPIDAKFPKEDYERLVDAAERGDPAAVEQAARDLDARVRSQARDIRDKYLSPPHTTDFGLLYLPTEGLYAEVARRAGLADALQREYRVVIVGPMTLAALLNSLQMGFRTLAIQKRSSEVWKVLGAVKTEFGKFGDTLERVKKKLDETGSTIEEAAHRSRQLEKKLKSVEAMPAAEAKTVLSNNVIGDPQSESPQDGTRQQLTAVGRKVTSDN